MTRRDGPFGKVLDRAFAVASTVSPRAAARAGRRLQRQRRYDEAEALTTSAVATFPDHAGISARHAAIAQADGRFEVAADRWQAVCARHPTNAAAWRGLAECARQCADIATATEAANRARALRPNDPAVLSEVAHAHDCAGRHDLAEPIWAALTRRRPGSPTFRHSHVHCLIRLSRLDEAQQGLAAGLRHSPDHPALMVAKGLLAMRREDWDEAFSVWSAFVAAYPDDEDGRLYLQRVASVRQLAAATTVEAGPLKAPIDVGRVEDDVVRKLMLRFESIGEDCEFGSVQRRYGAEPLALLRWNDVTFETFATALRAGFADMGEPATTELVVGEIGELYVRDRRWGLGMHTFLFAHEVSAEAMRPKLCRRVAFLRDKFLEDLRTAEKTLVFKARTLRFDDLLRLHEMLQAVGPVRLLHVRLSQSAGMPPWPHGAPGTIAELAPGLWVGYLDRMGDLTDIAFDQWVAICRALAAGAGMSEQRASSRVPELGSAEP